MNQTLKKANLLAVLLTVIFLMLFFVPALQISKAEDPTAGEEVETPTTPGEDNQPVEEGDFEEAPRLVTALKAWEWAEKKLYEMKYWESLVRDQTLRVPVSFAGQSIRIQKVWNGPEDATVEISSILLPGKTFGVTFYEMQKRIGSNVLLRRTSNQTSKREPIWENEGTLYTKEQFMKKRGILPVDPTFLINSSTVTDGSKRPINDGKTITFTLMLKAAASEQYAIQIRDASGSSTPAKFEDGDVKLDVTLNAKTGLFMSIKSSEKYNVTVMGMNTTVSLSGTEVFSAYRAK